jgi:hypothetical protein
MEPAIAFRVRDHERPALEVRVNFGVYAARNATPAEIDDLAHELRGELASFTIVAEERHEFGDDVETSLHQVVIEVDEGSDELAISIVDIAERWARACFAVRHSDLSDA